MDQWPLVPTLTRDCARSSGTCPAPRPLGSLLFYGTTPDHLSRPSQGETGFFLKFIIFPLIVQNNKVSSYLIMNIRVKSSFQNWYIYLSVLNLITQLYFFIIWTNLKEKVNSLIYFSKFFIFCLPLCMCVVLKQTIPSSFLLQEEAHKIPKDCVREP